MRVGDQTGIRQVKRSRAQAGDLRTRPVQLYNPWNADSVLPDALRNIPRQYRYDDQVRRGNLRQLQIRLGGKLPGVQVGVALDANQMNIEYRLAAGRMIIRSVQYLKETYDAVE
jgi:hypothetical protein